LKQEKKITGFDVSQFQIARARQCSLAQLKVQILEARKQIAN
jgi:hypothetical protein